MNILQLQTPTIVLATSTPRWLGFLKHSEFLSEFLVFIHKGVSKIFFGEEFSGSVPSESSGGLTAVHGGIHRLELCECLAHAHYHAFHGVSIH